MKLDACSKHLFCKLAKCEALSVEGARGTWQKSFSPWFQCASSFVSGAQLTVAWVWDIQWHLFTKSCWHSRRILACQTVHSSLLASFTQGNKANICLFLPCILSFSPRVLFYPSFVANSLLPVNDSFVKCSLLKILMWLLSPNWTIMIQN